jgi:tRNA acetyltransferase TAN1
VEDWMNFFGLVLAKMDFKLIITTFRGREIEAADEFKHLAAEFTGENPTCTAIGISGLIIIDKITDPIMTVKIFRQILEKEPWYFRYILRVIPIEAVCKTALTEIVSLACTLSCKIPKNSTFKIVIEKRFSVIKSEVIISKIANNIRAKVNLTSPEWLILVQILSKRTGVSVLKPDQILSVIKSKRDFSDGISR